MQYEKFQGALDVVPEALERMSYLINKRIGDSPSYKRAVDTLLDHGLAAVAMTLGDDKKFERAVKKVVEDAARVRFVLNFYGSEGERYGNFMLCNIRGIEYKFASYVDRILHMLFSGCSVNALESRMICPDEHEKNTVDKFMDDEHIEPRIVGPIGVLAITSFQEIVVTCMRLTAELRTMWSSIVDESPAVCIFGDGKYTLEQMAEEYDMPEVASACDKYIPHIIN